MNPTKGTDKIFPITTFISDLPTEVIPQGVPSSSEYGSAGGRLVVVGDVHGMRKSLEALLDKVDFDKRKGDHLILVGDLISKGPDSPGVVDLAIKLGASAVRGNHENAVLRAAAEIKASKDSLISSGGLSSSQTVPKIPKHDLPGDTTRDSEIPEKYASATSVAIGNSTNSGSTTHNTASILSRRQLDWIAALPLILRVKLPHNLKSSLGHTLLVVHAGLVPNIPIEEQDPYALLHMRSLIRTPGDEDGFLPAEISGDESWAVEWDQWQDRLASKTTVIFGHDAKRRLQLGRYTIGLDSACLYGHQLSAVVITASSSEIEHRVIQVECADIPVVPTVLVQEDGQTKSTTGC